MHVVQLFETPWTTTCQASLSITNSRSPPKPMSIKSVMPFNHLNLCHPLLLPSIFPGIRVFPNESALHIRWSKYCSFSLSISPSNEHPGLISFRLDWLESLQSKGLSRVFSNTTVQKHQFFSILPSFMGQHSHPYMTTGKTIALTRWTFVGKVMSLLVNTLSRLVITFSRNKYLLISWLQSPSAVILTVTGDGSKVWCYQEQYHIETWNVRSMNQGKLEVVKQEMARVNEHWHFRNQWTKMDWNG